MRVDVEERGRYRYAWTLRAGRGGQLITIPVNQSEGAKQALPAPEREPLRAERTAHPVARVA